LSYSYIAEDVFYSGGGTTAQCELFNYTYTVLYLLTVGQYAIMIWNAGENWAGDWSSAWCWQSGVCHECSSHEEPQSASDSCHNVEWTAGRWTAWYVFLLQHIHHVSEV